MFEVKLCFHYVSIHINQSLSHLFIIGLLAFNFSLEHLLKEVVREQRITLITHSMLCLLKLRQATSRLAAVLTDHLPTLSTVVLEETHYAEGVTAKHARVRL